MEAALLPTTYPLCRAISEARTATHDGYIWPVERRRMVDAAAITARMVEDIAALVRQESDQPCVTLDDLTRCGWHPAQTDRHGALAFKRFEELHAKPERRRTGNRSTVRRHSYAQEAAVLACFAFPIALLARQMLGV